MSNLICKENFNWKKYVDHYKDLKNINNMDSAWNHWCEEGKKQGRKFFTLAPFKNNKYYIITKEYIKQKKIKLKNTKNVVVSGLDDDLVIQDYVYNIKNKSKKINNDKKFVCHTINQNIDDKLTNNQDKITNNQDKITNNQENDNLKLIKKENDNLKLIKKENDNLKLIKKENDNLKLIKKEDIKVNEKKEDKKVNDKKEDKKVNDKKEDIKVNEKKEDKKVNDKKKEDKKVNDKKKEDKKVNDIKEDKKKNNNLKLIKKVNDKKENKKVNDKKENKKDKLNKLNKKENKKENDKDKLINKNNDIEILEKDIKYLEFKTYIKEDDESKHKTENSEIFFDFDNSKNDSDEFKKYFSKKNNTNS